MDDVTSLNVTTWLERQMTARGISLVELADMATIPLRLLRAILEPTGGRRGGLTVRQTFTLADALDTDPIDLINELDMLSERGRAYLPYCAAASEAPLGDLWQHARDLPDADRTVLLECVLCQRRRRWQAST